MSLGKTIILVAALMAPPVSAHPKILFVGHSTTLGVGATASDLLDTAPITGGYVDLLSRYWHGAQVVNAGCSGAGMPAFLIDENNGSGVCSGGGAWTTLVATQEPFDVSHLMFNGGVLTLQWWSTADKFESDLRALVIRLGGVVVISQHNMDSRYLSGPERVRFYEWRDRVAAVVADDPSVFLGADLVDTLDYPDDFDTDLVHPNQRGHAKLAVAISLRFVELGESYEFLQAIVEASK